MSGEAAPITAPQWWQEPPRPLASVYDLKSGARLESPYATDREAELGKKSKSSSPTWQQLATGAGLVLLGLLSYLAHELRTDVRQAGDNLTGFRVETAEHLTGIEKEIGLLRGDVSRSVGELSGKVDVLLRDEPHNPPKP
jgi:hypothetical protein